MESFQLAASATQRAMRIQLNVPVSGVIPLELAWTFLYQAFILSVNLKQHSGQTDVCQLKVTFYNDVIWVWSNVLLGSTLQQSQHAHHTKMKNASLCSLNHTACTSETQPGCVTPRVSASLNEVRCRTTLYVIQQYQELSSHVCKWTLFIF